jgi:hypothetical protein
MDEKVTLWMKRPKLWKIKNTSRDRISQDISGYPRILFWGELPDVG